MYFGRALLIALVARTVTACAISGKPDTQPENLHETLNRLATKHRVCAVAIALIKDRQLDTTDSATGCHPTWQLNPNSVFQAASLSKPVFAYAVLKLVEQGKLALDAPVVSYLPAGYRHQSTP